MKMKSPILLLAVLLFSLFLGDFVPLTWKSIAYGLSLTIKEVLIFVLPMLIFSFVFSSMVNLQKKAFQFVLFLLPLVCLSSFIGVGLAYVCGVLLIPQDIVFSGFVESGIGLVAPWDLKIPPLISNDKALIGGLILGLISGFKFPLQARSWSDRLLAVSNRVLSHFLIPVMPIFILGFTLKLQQDQVLNILCQKYLVVFLIIFGCAFGYNFLVYGALSRFQFQVWRSYLVNMWPAILTGFSTMSSAAAMPMSLLAGEKNTKRPEIVGSVVPTTVNIHLVGDCFATPIFALAILLSLGSAIPSIPSYAVFAIYFVLAKFAVAGVPGGGILVMLPVLEQCLGFSPEMLSLITALYILFDPVITAANVMGNGGFTIFFAQVFKA